MGFVVLDALEIIDERQAQGFQHVGRIVADVLVEFLAHLIENVLKQGVEQRLLVFEVPIERAARHARRMGDFVERRARNALVVENVEGGQHQLLSGLQGFGFCSSHGGSVSRGNAGDGVFRVLIRVFFPDSVA